MADVEPSEDVNSREGVVLVKVISGFRITLPRRVRDDYKLEIGTNVVLVRRPSGWLICRAVVSAVPPAPEISG